MALAAGFWHEEHKLDIFKTSLCRRLTTDGVCKWKSRCQFSHCPDWPRRHASKIGYSPEVCPKLEFGKDAKGAVVVTNLCGDKRCLKAHSKEEVLFHPQIFKTILCEEFMSNSGNSAAKKGTSSKRKRCHRFYCPFAHGKQELRESTLSEEQRQLLVRGVHRFPSDDCCKVCMPCEIPKPQTDEVPKSQTDEQRTPRTERFPSDASSSRMDSMPSDGGSTRTSRLGSAFSDGTGPSSNSSSSSYGTGSPASTCVPPPPLPPPLPPPSVVLAQYYACCLAKAWADRAAANAEGNQPLVKSEDNPVARADPTEQESTTVVKPVEISGERSYFMI